MTASPEDALQALGFVLPTPAAPVANYVPSVLVGPGLYIAGQLPRAADGRVIAGAVGAALTLAEGQAAACLCALHILAQARAALGSLARVRRVVKLTGYVVGAPGFSEHSAVINGASDIMAAAFGEAGRHTRVAVGAAGLPLGAAVEVDALFWVADA